MAAFIRDIAIILVAVEVLVVGVFLVILLWEIRNLAKMLREEILPIVHAADDTARTVRGTANFVSENVVQPVAKASGFVTGVTTAVRILVRRK